MQPYEAIVLIRKKPSATMVALTIASSLVLTTLAPAAPVPKNQTDWPNPQPRFTIQAAVSTRPNGDTPEVQPVQPSPTRLTEWRIPVRRRLSGHRFAPPNLNITTLALVTSAPPFKQPEWRNPARQRRVPQRFHEYYVVDESNPFAQTEWKNPRLRLRQPALRNWAHVRNLSISEPPKPHAQTAWPNPRLKGQSPELRKITVWRALGAVETIDDTPQSLAEWPTPTRLARAVSLLTWTQNLIAETLAPSARPFVPVAFENPQAKARSTLLLTHVEGRKFSFADDKPFLQSAWPLAVVAPRRRPETWTQGPIEEAALEAGFTPGVSTGRPNPALRQQQTLTWLDNLLGSTLAPEPDPRVQYDWPVPAPKGLTVDFRTWLQPRQAYYEDEVPAHQLTWPIPAPQRWPQGFGYWVPPQLGILGFPALVDWRIVVRADASLIVVRTDVTRIVVE